MKGTDTLPGLARRYGVSIDDIRGWNGLDGDIEKGQRLRIQLAQNIVTTTVDPLFPKNQFALRQTPIGWSVPLEEQLDANWTVSHIVGIYQALLWEKHVGLQKAAGTARDLLILVSLYYRLNGYELVGPLNPNVNKPPGLIDKSIRELRQDEISRIGGAGALGEQSSYDSYFTHNPLLFELTRLYWPSARASESAWGSILRHPALLADVDTIGRYGMAARVTQDIARAVSEPEQVGMTLENQFSLAWTQPLENVIGGTFYDEENEESYKANKQVLASYRLFLLNWPFGQNMSAAQHAAMAWVQNPIDYLRSLKSKVDKAMPRLLQIEKKGVKDSGPPPGRDRKLPLGPRQEGSILSRVRSSGTSFHGLLDDIDATVARLDQMLAKKNRSKRKGRKNRRRKGKTKAWTSRT